MSYIPRRRLYTACLSLIGVSIVGLLSSTVWTLRSSDSIFAGGELAVARNWSQSPLLVVDEFDSSKVVKGPPTNNFRDNLLLDGKYITSWVSAGWTNDVMTYINLIYLGVLTDRVSIIPPFTPSHIGGHVPPINFGEVFDIPRLAKGIRKPVLEWHQVKNSSSPDFDELGCWSVWEAVQEREHYPRNGPIPNLLKLDISYTKAPTWIKVIPRYEHDQHSSFSAVAALGFPEARAENAGEPRESEQHHVKLPPDDQLLCYDYLYYLCAHQPYEFDFDFSPAWLFVGQYMHWTSRLETIADEYLRRAFGTEENEATPPWIGIHIRRGDFEAYCGDFSHEDCYSSFPVIARRVEEVKQEILERKGITVNHVVMTSDERNATWWEGVKAQGWYGLDHSKTKDLYGEWYPVLLDAVVHSTGVGFVGTDRSTMSIVARRRVESWHDGAVRILKWGNPTADDH